MLCFGKPPYLECSSKGEKRLSAFYARIRKYGNKSIEELYQAFKIFEDGETGLDWRRAKGKKPLNLHECNSYYSYLWDVYIVENPDLIDLIKSYTGLSDIFGQEGHVCQAYELWRIRCLNI
jgi:hypothetical protein